MATGRSPAREGDVLTVVECRCGRVLARHVVGEHCDRCHLVPKLIARVVLGKAGAVPDPSTWVRL